jgi:hypothetical protein
MASFRRKFCSSERHANTEFVKPFARKRARFVATRSASLDLSFWVRSSHLFGRRVLRALEASAFGSIRFGSALLARPTGADNRRPAARATDHGP